MSRAIVISGGGSKGAFAVGVLKRLFEVYPNLDFDMIVGTSTGSLMAPLLAMKDIASLETLYSNQKTENIVNTGRLGDRLNELSIFDASPLQKLLELTISDQFYEAIKTSGKDIYLTTVCLQTEELVVFTTAENPVTASRYETRKIENADHFRRAVLASASQPVFMQPIKIDKFLPNAANPGFQYVDGGVREYAGIQMAIDNGATEIFTILLSSGNKIIDTKEYKDLFSILMKTIDIFTDDVGKNDLIVPLQFNDAIDYIDSVKKKMKRDGISTEKVNDYFNVRGLESPYQDKVPIKMHFFRPSSPLDGGAGGLNFDPVVMKEMIKLGARNADDFIAALNPRDITWA